MTESSFGAAAPADLVATGFDRDRLRVVEIDGYEISVEPRLNVITAHVTITHRGWAYAIDKLTAPAELPSGVFEVEVDGQRYRAAAVAWAIHHGCPPAPLHVWHRDGDTRNLRLDNLELQPKPFRQKYLTSKKKRYPKSDIYFSRRYGAWIAKYKGKYIKRDCLTKEEAINYRNNHILILKRKNAANC